MKWVTYDSAQDSEAKYSAQFDQNFHSGCEYMFLYVEGEVLRNLGCLQHESSSPAEVSDVNSDPKGTGKRKKETSTFPKSADRSEHPAVEPGSGGRHTNATDGRGLGNAGVRTFIAR